jgi:hypothetical protein
MIAAVAATLGVRLLVGEWSVFDVGAIALIVAIVGPFEWVVHKYALHAPEESWRYRVAKTGVGHRQHHVDPPDLQWLMLRPIDVGVYLPQIALMLAVIAALPLWMAGAPILGPYLTAFAAAGVGLAHYELTHLLVHTRYRPRSRYYSRLARHHRLHHFRNEQYWLGVTSNSGDRLLHTLPAKKTDVPLSDTARMLS